MTKPNANRRFAIEYDPRLVEEAVLLRVAGDREEKRFRRARDLIYELEDAEKRESRFREFHAEWFLHLQLGQPLGEALAEQPAARQPIRRCCVLWAPCAPEEGADLHELLDSQPGDAVPQKALLIRLKPERLLDRPTLQGWLRQELMHVADMLDPRFGYERLVPSGEAGPAYTNLLRDRYRVLWDTWIDGRLSRRGWLPEEARRKRREEFLATFPALGQAAEAKFQEIFDSETQTHAALMAFALQAGGLRGPCDGKNSAPRPCPLCRFPTYSLLSGATELSGETREYVQADFPNWQPEEGLCVQCADLYRMREMSRTAEAQLPRI